MVYCQPRRSITTFELGEDGRALYLKDGRIQVTWKNDSTGYLALSSLERDLGAEWIRTYLFPEYKPTPVAPARSRKTQAALANVKHQLPAPTETTELDDLPHPVGPPTIAVNGCCSGNIMNKTDWE